MKIIDLRITSVNVPFEATLRWACGVETGTTRAASSKSSPRTASSA